MKLTDADTAALVAFFTARLGETAQIARAASGPDGLDGEWEAESCTDDNANLVIRGKGWLTGPGSGSIDRAPAFHAARNDPAAVLASVAADRRLLAELESCQGDIGWDDALMFAARCRAMAWNSHPDYKPEWKP